MVIIAIRYQNMVKSDRQEVIRSVITVALAIIIITVIIAVLGSAFSSYMENVYRTPTEYFYSVSIRDLNGARTDGGVEILLPLPCINGTPVFSSAELTGSFSNWQSSVVTTDTGRMISLRNPNEILNDVDITYYKRSFVDFFPRTPSDACLNPCKAMENQSVDSIRRALSDFYKNSEHTPFYHSSDPVIDHAVNDSMKNDRPYERYTTVAINGSIITPRFRAIAVDLDFHVRYHYIRSYTVINETGNITISPVTISGG